MVIRTRSNGGRGNRPHRKVRTHQQIFQEHLRRKVQDSSAVGTSTSTLTEVKVKKERVENELSKTYKGKKTDVLDITEHDSEVSSDELESGDSDSYSSTSTASDPNDGTKVTDKSSVNSTSRVSTGRAYGKRKGKKSKTYYNDIRNFARKLVDNTQALPRIAFDHNDKTEKDDPNENKPNVWGQTEKTRDLEEDFWEEAEVFANNDVSKTIVSGDSHQKDSDPAQTDNDEDDMDVDLDLHSYESPSKRTTLNSENESGGINEDKTLASNEDISKESLQHKTENLKTSRSLNATGIINDFVSRKILPTTNAKEHNDVHFDDLSNTTISSPTDNDKSNKMEVDTDSTLHVSPSSKRKMNQSPQEVLKKKQYGMTDISIVPDSIINGEVQENTDEPNVKSSARFDTSVEAIDSQHTPKDISLSKSKVSFSNTESYSTQKKNNYINETDGTKSKTTKDTATNIVGILKKPGNIGRRMLSHGYLKQQDPLKYTGVTDDTSAVQHAPTNDFSLYSRTSTVSVGNVLKTRGFHMMEQKKKLVTPVKVEFNSLPDRTDFNVLEQTQTLFDLLCDEDTQLRILDVNKQVVLFERGISLPEGEDFATLMKTRNQTFRKGNSKVTIFFVVESTLSIQKLKYMDPIKTFIFDNNIWVKPDFFDTKIESSPGYFTLLHPKITNKMDYKEILMHAIHKITIDTNDEAVRNWYESNSIVLNETDINIPTFQLEPGIKKWGKIQTEVLRVTCSVDDANYVKYLLSKVGEMDHLDQGLFVPEGLHLMAGKEVVSQILSEQKDFLANITSIQLEGLSLEDMSRFCEVRKNTLKDYLLDIPGVLAVERTFYTTSRGQWLLVIDQKQSENVKQYFEEQLTIIYKAKRDCKIRLLTYQVPNSNKAYRLQILQDVIGKVGSYAEALTKRFSSNVPNKASVKDPTIQRQQTKLGHTNQPKTNNSTEFPPLGKIQHARSKEAGSFLKEKHTNASVIVHNPQASTNKAATIDINQLANEELTKADTTQSETISANQKLSETLITLREENRKQLEAIATVLEQKIDKVIESRMIELSNTVATTVAAQLLKTMRGLASSHKAKPVTHDSLLLTPQRTENRDSTVDSATITQSEEKQILSHTQPNTRTQDMLSELNKIGRQTKSLTDPPHDIDNTRNTGSTDVT